MDPRYRIADVSDVYSPALIFFADLIRANIAAAVRAVGDPNRLRPHVKTHKTREIVRLGLDAGITKYKCATIAEAEMVAGCGAPDVLLSYPIVGPNCTRMAQLARMFPNTRFSALAEHPRGVEGLSRACSAERVTLDVLLDIDVGQHRTGIAAGPEAAALYEQIHRSPGLRAAGLHTYDGHNHQESLAE